MDYCNLKIDISVVEAFGEKWDAVFRPTPNPLLKNHSCNYGHVQVAQMQTKSPQSHAKYKVSHIVNIVLKVHAQDVKVN